MSNTTASATDIVAAALHAGILAPSPHNTQPWEFRVHGETIEVLLDDTRVLGYCDPDAREATLACGAAVLNMRMTIAEQGRECVVEPLPDRARPLLLATVAVGGQRHPTPEEQRLASAVERRHTNRRPYLDREIPVAVRHALTEAAGAEGARLVLLDQAQRFDEFVALLRHADHLQQQDPRFLAELREWTHDGNVVTGCRRRREAPARSTAACWRCVTSVAMSPPSASSNAARSSPCSPRGATHGWTCCAPGRRCSGYCSAPPLPD